MFVHVPPFLQGLDSHSFTSQRIKYTRVKIKSERDLSLSRNAGQIPKSTVHCYWFSGDVPNWLGCYDTPAISLDMVKMGYGDLLDQSMYATPHVR